ncbi:MAG: lipoyl(octanoyl) transferase LipB [Halobacteriales archaeon]|nr:lipoyl(octanoyl) transferase LipB [Halobacteriales archaeon]
MGRELLCLDLGLREYAQAYAQMQRLHELRAEGQLPDLLLLVEHPHVVTLGRRGTRAQVFDPTLPIVETERGGEATYHGPGQLVAYPILHLAEAGLDVRKLVQALAQAAVRTFGDLGIATEPGATKELVGVWTTAHPSKKLASIGLAVKRGVSLHGIALNLNTDLGYFARIQPCGMDAAVMGSAARTLGRDVDFAACKAGFAGHFAAQLHVPARRVDEREVVARLQC